MKKFSFLSAVVAMSLTGAAHAGSLSLSPIALYDGSNSPQVTISYISANGGSQVTGVNTYADPQVSGGTTSPLLYCVDLWHDNPVGGTDSLTTQTSGNMLSFTNTSTFSDVENRVAFLLTEAQSTIDERAAVQLAIWDTIANKVPNGGTGFGFTVTSGDSTTISNDYNSLINWSTNGYNSGVDYSATFYVSTSGNQNMVEGGSGDFNGASVPEPSSLILGALGAIGLAGFYRRRGA